MGTMKKRILLFICIICCFQISKAQQTAFVQHYNANEYLLATAVTPNGGYYSIGESFTCPNDSVRIRYFDRDGNLKWYFRTNGYLGHSLGGTNGLCTAIGPNNQLLLYVFTNEMNHMLFNIDSMGNLIWQKQWVYNEVLYKKIIATSNGYFLLGNIVTSNLLSSAILTRISGSGNFLWSKKYTYSISPYTLYMSDMILKDNQLICAGRTLSESYMRPCVMQLDTSGTIIKSHSYVIDSNLNWNEFVQIEQTPKGNFYLLSKSTLEHSILKLNSQFDISWCQYYVLTCKAICAGYNEDVFTTYYTRNYLLHIDSSGNHLKTHYTKESQIGYKYELHGNYGFITSIAKRNCGFIITKILDNILLQTNEKGEYCMDSSVTVAPISWPLVKNKHTNINIIESSYTAPVVNALSINLVQFPFTVFTYCSSSYSCSQALQQSDYSAENYFSIYPNPASSNLIIDIKESSKQIEMDLIDLFGAVVLSKHKLQQGKNNIALPALSPGIYFARIKIDDHVYFKKIEKL